MKKNAHKWQKRVLKKFSASSMRELLQWMKNQGHSLHRTAELLGVAHQTAKGAAERLGIEFERYTMPKGRVATTPRPNTRYVTVDGELMSMHELSRRCGIHRTTLKYRIDVKGWSAEQAAKTPLGANSPENVLIRARSETHRLIREAARRNMSKHHAMKAIGVSRGAFEAALADLPGLEWPAVNKSVRRLASYAASRGRSTPKIRAAAAVAGARRHEACKREVNGKRASIDEHARDAGLNPSTVRRRMQGGMSLESALATPAMTHQQRRRGLYAQLAAAEA